MGLGLPTALLGNLVEGRDWIERALTLMRGLGDQGGLARCLVTLGAVWDAAEEWEQACAVYEESLALYRQIGDRLGTAQCLANMASTYGRVGDYARARELLAESLAARQDMGDRRGIAECVIRFAYLAFKQGRFAEALDGYTRCLKLFQELGNRNGIAICLYSFAVIYPSLDQPYRAACLLGATSVVSHDMYDLTGQYQAQFDEAVARARSQLGDATFEQAWAQGAGWPLDQAITYALETRAGS
jgi:tetratricopeptide (TPR) repeat protein